MSATAEITHWHYLQTPIGPLRISASINHIVSIEFADQMSLSNESKLTHECVQQLHEYFLNSRTSFNLPIEPAGTYFQREVWTELLNIPYGQCISYQDLARRLDSENGSRAVGTANGANPIPIIIPCHRVIGSNGKLVGYAGGLQIKKWLLQHEGYIRQLDLFRPSAKNN